MVQIFGASISDNNRSRVCGVVECRLPHLAMQLRERLGQSRLGGFWQLTVGAANEALDALLLVLKLQMQRKVGNEAPKREAMLPRPHAHSLCSAAATSWRRAASRPSAAAERTGWTPSLPC